MTQSSGDPVVRSSRGQDYPVDRFDRIPRSGRVGAHRVTPRPRRVWQYVLASVLGFLLLTTLGVIGVHSIGSSVLPIGPSPGTNEGSVAPKTTAELDPEATVAVLDGTPNPDLGVRVDEAITREGWGQVVFAGKAITADVAISAIFYRDPADEAAALGLAEQLGGASVYPTEDYAEYGARLIVLLGADYGGPGLEPEVTPEPEPEPQIDPTTGYQIDPATGYLIDPATGLFIDPGTGQLLDPATLQPVQ